MAGDGAAQLRCRGPGRSRRPPARRRRRPPARTGGDRGARIVARRVDVALPGDHVVEAGAQAGVAGPQDAVLGRRGSRSPAGALRSPRCRPAWRGCRRPGRRSPCRRGRRSACAAARRSSGRCAPAAMSDSMRKFWFDVGIARARRELQRARAADHARGLGVAERRLGRRAVQHRHRPVVAQARTGCGTGAARPAPAARAAAGGRARRRPAPTVGEGVQHQAAGELLGDRAHAEQRARREGDAPLGIGPAPGVAGQHLALAQHGDRAAGPGIGARQGIKGTLKVGEGGVGHGRYLHLPTASVH